jgi:HD-like signal output (HDOD) protein
VADLIETLGAALEDIVAKGTFDVPPYPAVALRLQRILARPNHGLAEVADAISSDPALAARVLGAANSAAYGATQEITTISRAVVRLGSRTVSALSLAAGLGVAATQAGVLFDAKYLAWRRSVTCALACQKLATFHSVGSDDAFLVGLLHGFGRSLAIAALEKLVTTERPSRPLGVADWLAIAERERGKLTAAVAKRWSLPQTLVEPLGEDGAPAAWRALLARANQVALALETGRTPAGGSEAESRALDELVRGLPAALDAFAAVPSPAPVPVSGVVAKSDRVLEGDLRPSALGLADRRKRAAPKLRTLGIAADGLAFESSVAFQESSMVRLSIGAETEQFEPWLNVVLCVPTGASFRVEAQLFSPTREVKQRWQALFASAASAGA